MTDWRTYDWESRRRRIIHARARSAGELVLIVSAVVVLTLVLS